MERHTRLSRAAVVLVAIALIASIAAAVWFASPDAPYVPSEDSGAALGAAAPAEDGYAEHETTVPGGYTPVRSDSDVDNMRSNGRKSNNKYILMNNIEIDSIDLTAWTGADGSPWNSELDGNGYTITINAATASGAYYDTGGLFSVIGGGANVHDLTIVVQNVRVDNNEGNANFGVIAGNACGAVTVDNVYIRLDKDSSGNGDAYVSSNGTTWLGGVFGKVEGSGVSIRNTTVYNAAAGSRGFSGTMVNNSGVYVGGFVGSIDKGDLTASNIAYKADDDAKIFAVAESGASGWGKSNTTLTGGVLGYHNEGSFTLDGLIFDAQVSLGSSFGTQNGKPAHAAYIVGQVDGGLSDVWSDIYINAANGTTWLDGNNETRGNFIRYDAATFTDARFTDDEKIAFAVARQNPASAGSVMRTIVQENTTTTLSDAEIADIVSSGEGPAWITVDRVNATGKNSLSIGSKATAGTYNVQNYDTVSSADDSAYRGSKVYDKTTVKTPTLNVGGTTVNAWTADSTSTTADVGTKTFSYNENALSGYAAATYNGGTYLVRGGTIYSPGTITVNGVAQPFDLGKDFVYEITKAPVEVVVANIPGTFYDGDPMPKLTVQSVTPNVPGDIAWKDSSLVYGQNEYVWTWTPEDNNYQPDTGTVMLEVLQATINEIVVSGDFETQYTAYDAFNPNGMVVTAYYAGDSEHKRGVVLESSDYTVTVANGVINRLLVTNTFVTVPYTADNRLTDTAAITVSKLAVDVPNENQGLVYNGAEQIGVAVSADNYYSLKGNTGTNAAAYTATATLTDTANTRWDTDTEDDTTPKEIGWSIAKENVAITVMHTSKTYDGQEVNPTTLFTAQGVNDEELALTVAVDGGKTILNAGTYSVTASLAESETNYTAKPVTITYKVDKKLVSGEIVADNLVYDGTEKGATFNGQLIGEDKVEIKYAGDRINVTEAGFTATAVLPSGDNYAWADGVAPSATFMITPKTVNVTATSGSKEFAWIMASASELYELFELDGEKVNAEDKLIWKVNGEVADMSDGNVSEIFDAKEYRIEIASADANYTLVGTTSTTFTITPKKVEKPTVSDTREFTYNGGEQGFEIEENPEYEVKGDAKATDAGDYSFTIALKAPGNVVWSDGTTEAIAVDWKINNATFTSVTIEFAEGALDNLFTSSAMPTPTTITAEPTPLPGGVEGKFEWVESSLSEDTNTYHWTYTVPNYNVFEGTQELTAQAAVLESITLSGEYKTEYTAYDFFDIDNLVVTAHFSHGENQPGEDTTLALGEYTLTTASAQYDENGVPQLFVADGYVTVTYQGKSEQIVIKVAPKQIAAPNAATGLVYDGTEKDGVTGGDGYTLSGDTKATDANDYFATAVLTDKDNTTWTDGTTDDKTIEWSIAKMVVSGAIVAPESLVYDGAQKTVSFDGQLAGNDEFGIDYDGDRQNVTADGFTVTVSLPNDNNYEWADDVVTTAAYKIEPKRVYLGHGDYTWGVSYNGKAILVAELGGNTGDGNVDLVFAYEDETLETKLDIVFDYVAREANGLTSLVDAGEYTIEFNLADSVVNYVAEPYTTTLEITPMRVEATLTAPNEVYTGNEKNAILTVKTQLVGEDKVTVEYNNVNRIDYTGEEIVATAQLPNDNYVWADGTAPTASFTIQKAAITRVTVTISDTPDGGWTTAMMPEFTSVSVEPDVEGEVVWDNGSLIAGEKAEQPWTFFPDSQNYEPYHGSVTLTVSQATLTDVFVEIVATKEYVAFDAFDRSSIAVEALYGEDRKPVTTGYTLTFSIGDEDRLLAGTGITVTVTYTDGDVTQDTEFTIDVAKRTVAKPVVGDTTFEDKGGQITLEIAPSEFYTVTGNTGFGVGSYQATVSLVDADNTVWEDGSTDDVLISWTITEPVTSDEVIADILAMEKVTWQNAEEFLDLEARYNALDKSEQTAEATAKLAVLRAQYEALRNAAFGDIEAAHEVTAKSLGKALAAAAAGLSAAAIALAIAKRRSI